MWIWQGKNTYRFRLLLAVCPPESGQRYLYGWTLTYNLFREHESIDDRTPGEAAKVSPPFREWTDVVRGGSSSPRVLRPKIVRAVEEVQMPETTPIAMPTPKVKHQSPPRPLQSVSVKRRP